MISGYKELTEEIALHEHMLDAHYISLNYWKKKMYKWMPIDISAQQYTDSPRSSDSADTMTVMCKVIGYQSLIDEEQEVLKSLKEQKRAIDNLMKNKETKEKVETLHRLGMKPVHIAEFLELTERHVRRVIQEMKRG